MAVFHLEMLKKIAAIKLDLFKRGKKDRFCIRSVNYFLKYVVLF